YEYPREIEDLTKSLNWTHRMNAVFDYMNSKYSIKKHDIIECLHQIEISDPMKNLLRFLHSNSYNLIIISDANSIFIEEILEKNGLFNLFSKIYTNKAHFCDQTECLKVQPFNEEFNLNKELFKCPTQICSSNICKGSVLLRHLEENSNGGDKKLVYVGDGHNDYCPGLSLSEQDFYFVRDRHSLSRLLEKRLDLAKNIKSQVFKWVDGDDILKQFN
ncbi:unnamed protein product, partial [Brachionus calyciflorus]